MLSNQYARNCIVSKFFASPPDHAPELKSDELSALFGVYVAVRDPLVQVLGMDVYDWIIGHHPNEKME